MLLTNVNHFEFADYAKVQEAVDFVRDTDWSKVPLGRIDVNADFYVQVLSYETEDINHFDFEIHRRRLDIHAVIEGQETIEVSDQRRPALSYLQERDLAYVQKPDFWNSIVLHRGDLLIIGRDELHRTNGLVNGESNHVKKVVLKMTR